MNLCIDIGNSKISAAVFSGSKLMHFDKISYAENLNGRKVDVFFKKLSNQGSIDKAAVASVSPKITVMVQAAVKTRLGLMPRIISSKKLPQLKILYKKPEQLGIDRLINAYAVFKKYGGPAVAVDIGTAITWDIVTAQGEYLGGSIAPGPGTMAKALRANTALLPLVNISGKPGIIGRDTKECIQSGLYWGTAGMVKELVRGISRKFRGKTKIIITGGLGKMFQPLVKGSRFDEHLTLQGINMLLEETK